jgi:two-component system chemotaxis family response regulator WspR
MSENNNNLEAEIVDQDEHIVVLLVDDQMMVAEGIRRMLEGETDIDFHYCNDPKKAVDMAAEIKPTTILQDLIMPDIDGMTLVRFYRNHPALKDIPIIVLSSKEDPLAKSEAFSNGASDYLVKLPDKIELIARIRAHSRSYLAQQQRDEAFRDLRDLKKELEVKNRELERLSTTDSLMGIANRRSFEDFIDKEWRRATREEKHLSIILIDIDHFKAYNDNYGHQGGDECLRKVASRLSECLKRGGDKIARYGGEELVVVLPNTSGEGALTIAEELRAGVESLDLKHEYSNVADHVTISLGVASMLPTQGVPLSELVTMADEALYAAKDLGRNRSQFADSHIPKVVTK